MAGYPNSQGNVAGAIPVYTIANASSGASSKNIAAAGNTQVKTGAGTFLGLSVNTGQSGATVTVYDGTSAAGIKLGTFSAAAQGGPAIPGSGLAFTTGLFVVVAGSPAPDVTVVYM